MHRVHDIKLAHELKAQQRSRKLGAEAHGNGKITAAEYPHAFKVVFRGNEIPEEIIAVKAHVGKDFVDNLLFSRKGEIEGGARNFRLLADVVDGNVFIAALAEKLYGGIDNEF